MKQKIWMVSLIVLLYVSCRSYKQKDVRAGDVSVTCPEGWKNKFKNLGGAYSLSIQTVKGNSSGLAQITWVPLEADLEVWLDDYQTRMEASPVFGGDKMEFSEKQEGNFGSYRTTFQSFKSKVMGLAFEGEVHVFYYGEKSFLIVKQGAVEDRLANSKGFKLIEQTFKVTG